MASDPFEAGLVLKAGREYCRKLEKAALDFVCLEEIKETVDLSRDIRRDPLHPGSVEMLLSQEISPWASSSAQAIVRPDRENGRKIDNVYLYDYQFVRQAEQVKERRTLLQKNGKKPVDKTETPGPMTFNYADILLAPVRLLDDRFSEYYEYRLLGTEEVNGATVSILEVRPRLTFGDRYLGGTVRLKKDDGSILSIAWDTTTFGRYENIVKRAEFYKAKPQATSRTEFAFEKNGLRFPSADITEEAYVDADGKIFVRARTGVTYSGYKFFTVEVETGAIK